MRTSPSRLLAAPLATLAALALTGCVDRAVDREPDPAKPSSAGTSSSPSATGGGTGEVVGETRTPEGCTFPALRELDRASFALLHGEQERTAVPGVSLLLTTSTPGASPATIEVGRRVVGCVGSATVRVPASQEVTVLGMRLGVSPVTAAVDVPNRASATVTVLDSGE